MPALCLHCLNEAIHLGTDELIKTPQQLLVFSFGCLVYCLNFVMNGTDTSINPATLKKCLKMKISHIYCHDNTVSMRCSDVFLISAKEVI